MGFAPYFGADDVFGFPTVYVETETGGEAEGGSGTDAVG